MSNEYKLPEPKHRGPDGTGSYFDSWTAEQMHAAYAAGQAAEREACAELANDTHPNDWAFIGSRIRARGKL